MTRKKILIATGGTGGHIFPAYSLAKYLMNCNHEVKLTTDDRGLKYLKNFKELNLIKISSSPFIRKNILRFFVSISIITFSIIKSFFYLSFNRPSIIFGVGGYSSFPICIAASILRIKFIIYENNLILGKANKYLLPFAEKMFVSFIDLEGVKKKYEKKIIEVGNIIRQEIIESKISIDQNSLDKLKILVLGGSQAAKPFAEELPEIFLKVKNSGISIEVFQQCLQKQNTQLSNYYKKAEINHEIFNFTDDILNYYLKANLVITRSGASVLGELLNVKKPFISIPLPSAADQHQLKNAEFYKKKGYGFLLEEKDIKKKLFDLIKNLSENKELIKDMLFYQKQHSDKDIFTIVNNELEKILNEKN